MKIVARFIILIVIVTISAAVYLLIQFPFLSPWYHNKYNQEAYTNAVTNIETISYTETETCIISRFETLYPYWLGTSWDFNGTTQIPGDGNIACGYFVTTLVRDMHFDIPRVELAQCASEEMIKALVEPPKIKRFNGTENELMLSFIKQKGRNLYIVGLDTHTGFILNDGADTWFIHSSGSFPFCVIKEHASKANVLLTSKYKVLGNLSESTLIWSM